MYHLFLFLSLLHLVRTRLVISDNMQACLTNNELFWPEDNQCYKPGTTGPCAPGEWIVARIQEFVLSSVCQQRPCSEEDSECEQPDLDCGVNEREHFDPFGHPICGCIRGHHFRLNGTCERICPEGLDLRPIGGGRFDCLPPPSTAPTSLDGPEHRMRSIPFPVSELPAGELSTDTELDNKFRSVLNDAISNLSNLCNFDEVFSFVTGECEEGATTGNDDNLEDFLKQLLNGGE